MPIHVTVCVGSSCHIRGSRTVINRFVEILRKENLEGEVVLSGSFCMERCGECMNWTFEEEQISSATVEEAEETLRQRLTGVLKRP